MLSTKTSHKRRRSSARGDASRAIVNADRAIVTVAGSAKGKQKAQEDGPSWAWTRMEKMVESHPINHSLQVLLPGSGEEDLKELLNILPSTSQAYLVRAPITLFLDPIFITSHIKRGKLIALSKGDLDFDDVICLDGHGVLHLSLTRDSYQTLGLVGQSLKQSRTSSGKGRDRLSGKIERWLVRIDLLAPSFTPGKPGFDRTMTRLRDWDASRTIGQRGELASWDFLVCWTGWQSSSSSSGKTVEFPSHLVPAHLVVPLNVSPDSSILSDCSIPRLPSEWKKGWSSTHRGSEPGEWNTWNDALDSISEWAALASMSSECVRSFWRTDMYNGYQVEAMGTETTSSLAKIRYAGLLPSELCLSVLRSVRSFLQMKGKKERELYALVACCGFSDSPVVWSLFAMPGSGVSPLTTTDMQNSDSSVRQAPQSHLDADFREHTGPRARRRRHELRAKRGTITRDQLGCQVKRPGSSGSNGWQVILLGKPCEEGQADYISVENVSGCLKC